MIYLLRHGLDDERFIGGYSQIGLIPEGIRQVKEIAAFIETNNLEIQRIISSDVKRAIETAQIVNQRLDLDITYDSTFRELDKGKLNGMPKETAKIEYPEYIDVKDIKLKYPNGESMQEFYERIKESLEYILSLDNVLIITHRGVINMLYYILNNVPLDMDKEKFNVTHASLHELNPKTKSIGRLK